MSRPTKTQVRERIWSLLEARQVAAFPGARGRIPNFKGAWEAARRLAETEEWRRAETLKCNPDAPQRPVRLLALRQGKRVYMAVPRLRDRRCFWELEPRRLGPNLTAAASIAGAARLGRPVEPSGLPRIDLVIAGSVAVHRSGVRVGKGGGFSDLEYAIARALGAIDERTVVATTVHPLQIVNDPPPVAAHDIFLDLIVTPDEVIRTRRRRRQPRGVLSSHLSDEQRREIPILGELGY